MTKGSFPSLQELGYCESDTGNKSIDISLLEFGLENIEVALDVCRYNIEILLREMNIPFFDESLDDESLDIIFSITQKLEYLLYLDNHTLYVTINNTFNKLYPVMQELLKIQRNIPN